MSSIAAIPRAHLTLLICLPVAILLGVILAEPTQSSSLMLLAVVLAVVSIPFFMRWHHAVLVFACNAVVLPLFVPGRPPLWLIAAAISMFLLVLDRSVGHKVNFFRAKQVSLSLLFLVGVVFVTCYVTGGFGMNLLGSSNGGGRHYIFIGVAVMVYFALATISISPDQAGLAVGGFFLSALTGAIGYLTLLSPALIYLIYLFPVEGVMNESSTAEGDVTGHSFTRYGGLSLASIGLFCFVLSRFGIRGMLEFSKPWRWLLFALALVGCLLSGFRTNMVLFIMTFGILFWLEGLLRTKYFTGILIAMAIAAIVIIPNSQKLPQSVQRTLCFLPLNWDPYVRASAEDSTEWRLELWRELYPMIPDYLIKGKGLSISQEDVYKAEQAAERGYGRTSEIFILTGDYHSGPLSLIIPFGLFGVAGFIWFAWAAIKVLSQNRLYGDPSLAQINSFLLAYFVAHLIFYIFVFGSFFSDLVVFTSLVGLSVSLNGGVARPLPKLSPAEARMN